MGKKGVCQYAPHRKMRHQYKLSEKRKRIHEKREQERKKQEETRIRQEILDTIRRTAVGE